MKSKHAYIVGAAILMSVAAVLGQSFDLTLSHFATDPSPIYVGDKVVFMWGTKNLGADDLPQRAYEVELYLDGELISFDRSTAALSAGQSNSYSMADGYWNWIADKAGEHRYRYVADPKHQVAETNEANNIVEGTFKVLGNPQASRVPQGIAYRPREAELDSTVRFHTYSSLSEAVEETVHFAKFWFTTNDLDSRPSRSIETNGEFIISFAPFKRDFVATADESKPDGMHITTNTYLEVHAYKDEHRKSPEWRFKRLDEKNAQPAAGPDSPAPTGVVGRMGSRRSD